MEILIKKIKGIDRYQVFKNGEKTLISVSYDSYNSDKYYLIYEGNRLKGRFSSRNEVMEYLRLYFLEKNADLILGKK